MDGSDKGDGIFWSDCTGEMFNKTELQNGVLLSLGNFSFQYVFKPAELFVTTSQSKLYLYGACVQCKSTYITRV